MHTLRTLLVIQYVIRSINERRHAFGKNMAAHHGGHLDVTSNDFVRVCSRRMRNNND